MSTNDILELLKECRGANTQHNITGFLIYYDGCFVQVIEGASENISALWENIQKDQRHHNLILINDSEIEKNEFPNWSMGFINISTAQASKHLGGVAINSSQDLEKYVKNPGIALKFLQGFALSYTGD